MIDSSLSMVKSMMTAPKGNVKFRVDARRASCDTFFKVKKDLEVLAILSLSEDWLLRIDAGKAQNLVLKAYPGLPDAFQTSFKRSDLERNAGNGAVDHEGRTS
jgi:hypothetical protein